MTIKPLWRGLSLAIALSTAVACSAGPAATTDAEAASLIVHKSPTCGCCGAWVEHIREHGLTAAVEDTQRLAAVKQEHGIGPRYQSCHTAVSDDGNYFFEGHVPAKVIQAFLANPPKDAAGLAVPGMPLGSPGMEMGGRFTPYDVVQINDDGSTEIYATVDDPAEQY